MGLDDSIDRGIVSDTTCLSILREIGVFENPEHESRKSRPIGEKRALVTSVENGLERKRKSSRKGRKGSLTEGEGGAA